MIDDVVVTTRGSVEDAEKEHARERIAKLDRHTSKPVLAAKIALETERNPRFERRASARAELNVNGHVLRAHVAAETMSEAIDALSLTLERQLRDLGDRRASLRRRAVRAAGPSAAD